MLGLLDCCTNLMIFLNCVWEEGICMVIGLSIYHCLLALQFSTSAEKFMEFLTMTILCFLYTSDI